MKRALSVIFTMIVALLLGTPSQAAQGANVVGSWDFTVESPNGKNTSVLVIKKDGDKFSAVAKGPRGERPLENVSVAGSDISFVMKIKFQDQDMVITYKGKVEKDSMKGEADFGGLATGPWSAVPHKEGDAAPTAMAAPQTGGTNVTGEWNVTVETSAGSGSPSFTFKQEGEKLTGMYKGQFGESPLTGTVKGADITFTIKINAQGQDLTIVYTGKVESKDSMKGKVALGELGEGTFTGKRK